MNKLKKYAGLLNEEAPENHFLAYITPSERDMLVDAGGKKTSTPSGIFAYPPPGEKGGAGYVGGSSSKSSGSHSRSYNPGAGGVVQHSPTKSKTTSNTRDNRPDRPNPHTDSGTSKRDFTKAELGMVDAEDEYMEPDKDHWKATQKAIKKHQKDDSYKADWNDWSKEQKKTYQLEMNKLKGTEGKNYSFYKGNEGTTNLSFGEHWKDVAATNPIAANSLILRLLIAGGRTLKENFTTDYGTWKYGSKEGTGSGKPFDSGGWFGKIFNKDGSVKTNLTDDQINEAYNQATPDLSHLVGGTKAQPSMVNQYFSNLGNSNLGISSNYTNTYNQAKANIAKSLNMTPNTQQYGYTPNPYSNYSRSMTSANPFYDELKTQGLI